MVPVLCIGDGWLYHEKQYLQANGMISTIRPPKQSGEGFGGSGTAPLSDMTPTSESLVNEVKNAPNYRMF